MKKVRKVLALLLTVSMLFGTVMSVSATGITDAENESEKTTTVETVPSDETSQETTDAQTEEPQTEQPQEGTDQNVPSEDVATEGTEEAVAVEEPAVEESATYVKASDVPIDTSVFRKVFHVDAGRKYFTVDQIKRIIDLLSQNDYTHLELALGNDGLRFLLDDMSVIANGKTYSSEEVKAGIQQGNKSYAHAGEYTQAEMDDMITYANSKNIEIIPLINSPGHMDAILDAMKAVGIRNPAYVIGGKESVRTVDITNQEAVNFTVALLEKYITYFASKGSTMFNMGCDEYANDISNGFSDLIKNEKYNDFAKYVNRVANSVKASRMIPVAFNDGIYYNKTVPADGFDSNIVISYWTAGWWGYSPADAEFLKNKGHEILNTNDAWYYVLGVPTGNYSLDTAKKGIVSTPAKEVKGGKNVSPIGSMVCLWCDNPNNPYNEAEEKNIEHIITTFADKNRDLFNPGSAPEPEKPTDRTITVQVGEKVEDIIEGESYTDQDVNKDSLDPNIADVTVTSFSWELVPNGVQELKSTDEYVIANKKENGTVQLLTNAGGQKAVTVKDGIIQGGVTADTIFRFEPEAEYWRMKDKEGTFLYPTAALNWLLKWGYYVDSKQISSPTIAIEGTEGVRIHRNVSKGRRSTETYLSYSSSGYGADNVGSELYLFKRVKKANATSTKVTFAGKNAGTTYVTVGNIKYTINVVDNVPVNPMNSSELTIEYWITNSKVHENKSDKASSSVKITREEASSDEGFEIATKVEDIGYSDYDGWVQLHYWQSMRLDSKHHQETGTGDQTINGTAMTHVRWKNKAWQYKTVDGLWHYFLQGDQAVAYYMRHTTITKEITTAMKDWGYTTEKDTPNTSGNGNNEGQVALTVAVVYPDGTVSPVEKEMYANSTIILNYWKNRDIGIIAPINNGDYDISKITVTDGKRDKEQELKYWKPTDTISWNKKTNVAGKQWYDEKEVWNDTLGTKPVVNGFASNIRWSGKNTAKLVLIYLQPVHHESNLLVQWVDDSAKGEIIKTQEVVVDYTGDIPTTFLNGLNNNGNSVQIGKIDLHDEAYIINKSGAKQYFNKDLTTIPNIAGQYTSGLYKYVKADISEDGKTLTLHYDLDEQSLSKQYVVDFGLPVEVPLSELVANADQVTNVEIVGNASYDAANKKITYTRAKTFNNIDSVTVQFQYSTGEPSTISIGFVPATTVYYEEGFATLKGFTGGSKGEGVQALEVVGNKTNNYGYDESAKLHQVGPSNGTQATSTAYGDSAEFVFTGTGVDIYANTDTQTGQLFVQVKNSTGKTVKMIQVNTAMADGQTDSTQGQAVTAYNVPVISLDLQTLDTYTLRINHVKSSAEATGDTVNLDGFRVYGTLPGDTEAYVSDKEANPVFTELRDHVLAGLNVDTTKGEYASQLAKDALSQVYSKTGVTNGAVVLSSASMNTGNVEDLLNNGPKNELYLRPNQSVTFKPSVTDIQIGLKALNAAVTYSVNNGQNISLNSSTDMFYTVTPETNGSITITNKSQDTKALLSITKIKAVNGNSVAMMDLTAEDLVPAVMSLGVASDIPTEPQPPVEPENPEVPMADATANIKLVDYRGKALATTAVAVNGQEGTEAVIAGADLKAAAEQVLPKGYAFADESKIADETVICGQSKDVKVQIGKVATLTVTYKKLFGKKVGTATFTAVQTSSSKKHTFSAAEIRKAAPKGYRVLGVISTKVKFGAKKDISARVF